MLENHHILPFMEAFRQAQLHFGTGLGSWSGVHSRRDVVHDQSSQQEPWLVGVQASNEAKMAPNGP